MKVSAGSLGDEQKAGLIASVYERHAAFLEAGRRPRSAPAAQGRNNAGPSVSRQSA